jgi:hypothetical protein
MTISFRPATRENVNLLIGLAGGTGSGKTYTGCRLASGMAGSKRFAVIDTENGRASHYADQFRFDVAQLHAPFTPAAYTEAILAADQAGYPVIMVDSMSHEYAGEGGVLDMQEAEFTRMGGRGEVKVASWIKPKNEHKRMVQRLLQARAHLILCFRAEPKIEIAKQDGKTVIVPKQSLVGLDGWIPVAEKNLPFELTVSLLFTADKPGVPKPIKLQEQHRALFPLDKPVTEESGRLVAAWAAGGPKESAPREAKAAAATATALPPSPQSELPSDADLITPNQVADLEALCQEHRVPLAKLREKVNVTSLAQIKSADYARAVAWVNNVAEARRAGGASGEARA